MNSIVKALMNYFSQLKQLNRRASISFPLLLEHILGTLDGLKSYFPFQLKIENNYNQDTIKLIQVPLAVVQSIKKFKYYFLLETFVPLIPLITTCSFMDSKSALRNILNKNILPIKFISPTLMLILQEFLFYFPSQPSPKFIQSLLAISLMRKQL